MNVIDKTKLFEAIQKSVAIRRRNDAVKSGRLISEVVYLDFK